MSMQKPVLLSEIKKAVKDGRVRITDHADEEMAKDELAYGEVRDAILKDEVIETYADDKPFPSCLVYGKHNEKHIHAVCAYSEKDMIMVLITVYIPDQDKWIKYR
ncbi:MAG: DUF4258 domain-containing protein, partial [Methanosarcinales archaeon]|nr:DUF4258 domain-containing protein [Candidatus Ethanoperedens thermophilum]